MGMVGCARGKGGGGGGVLFICLSVDLDLVQSAKQQLFCLLP